MSQRASASLMASPVLVGTVTVLVTIVAVFLSYNANSGLPFVPTYTVNVLVPDAAGLVKGNEVRVGGKRVGVVKEIKAVPGSKGRPISKLTLALEQRLDPMLSDTRVVVRPRSPLGLRYVQLNPGDSGRPLAANATLPFSQSRQVVELDQALAAFDANSRRDTQQILDQFGSGLAGRGADFNEFLAVAPPLLSGIDRVSANLADPRTGLRGFIRGADAFVGELAAAGGSLGSVIDASDTTAGAFAAVPDELAATIDESPATFTAGISALRAARPVLDDATGLVRDIRPGARLLRPAAAELDRAIDAGIPVVRRALVLTDDLEGTLAAVQRLSADKRTSDALVRLRDVLDNAKPTVDFLTPFQTQCNYLGLWTRNAPSSISEGDAGGNWFRTVVVQEPEEMPSDHPAPNLHVNPLPHAAGPGTDGECEAGNEPFLPGQQIGNIPGNQGKTTELTAPPPGTPKGP